MSPICHYLSLAAVTTAVIGAPIFVPLGLLGVAAVVMIAPALV
jgi:hypothetical protein